MWNKHDFWPCVSIDFLLIDHRWEICHLSFSSIRGTMCDFDLWYQDFPGGSVVKNLPAMQELQEPRVWSLGQENPLEEGMTTHSSILAWRIPWTEEPGGLQYIGSDMTEVTSHTCNACSIKVPTRWHLALLGKVENSSEVAQSCPILWDPMDRSLPGSSVQGIFEARVLEWGAISFSTSE